VDELTRVRQLIFGARTTQLLYVAVATGILDLLTEQPQTADGLAAATGADSGALRRVLRALAAIEVVNEEGDAYTLTGVGEGVHSLRAMALNAGQPYVWRAWGELLHSVRTGETAFDHVYGESVWEYRAKHPEESKVFDAFMTEATRGVDETIVSGFDFGRFTHIVDVAGGAGAFLQAILRQYPAVRGTLFDQPHVVPTDGPFEIAVGSFFEDLIPRGADAYVLKWILHDWDDDRVVVILRNVAAAMPPGAHVLVVERDLADAAAVWVDLQMLVMVGGRERTDAEYAGLFKKAGLAPVAVTRVGAGHAVFEAQKG
jgi:O-methyltransferase domain/Dimerisation domain